MSKDYKNITMKSILHFSIESPFRELYSSGKKSFRYSMYIELFHMFNEVLHETDILHINKKYDSKFVLNYFSMEKLNYD